MEARSLLHRTITAGLLAVTLTCAPSSALDLDIEQGFQIVHGLDQTLSLTMPTGQVSAADLRPLAAWSDRLFRYVYRLAAPDGGWSPPLALDYADDAPSGLAFGWQLLLELGGREVMLPVPVLTPAIEVTERGGRTWISWELDEFPASSGTFEGSPALLVDLPGPEPQRLVFARLQALGPLAPVALLAADGAAMRFDYRAENGRLALEGFRLGERTLRVERAGDGTVARLILVDGPHGGVAAEWRFTYGTGVGARLLEAIAIVSPDGSIRQLRFAYSGKGSVVAQTVAAAGASIWQRVEGDPQWRLPGRLTMRVAPGLRFIDLNDDRRLDLVVADKRGLQSWLRAGDSWREITHCYQPPFPVVNGSEPLGAQFINFPKHYIDARRNTDTFPSLLVSRYGPASGDPTRLAFEATVCFPPVKNAVLQNAAKPEDWDCDCAKPLQLPVPLQFEGEPWPKHLPGIAAVERRDNQGARIVSFDLPLGRKPQLFYIGLRYRDARTGNVLLAADGQAPFRDTRNCVERYETEFEQGGEKRRVKVDICQAFWRVERGFWKERDSDSPLCQRGERSSFWRRMDLGTAGQPNGKFILPWQDDSRYHYHYEHFRSVSFPRLKRSDDRYVAFAVVQGHGGGTIPSNARPPARDIFGLLHSGRWEKLSRSTPYYPPDRVFEEFDVQFLDLDGDGTDDAVVARGKRRLVYLNRLDTGSGWVEQPDYALPRDCDLGNGDCQAVDLDGDGDLDLLVGDGRVVFLNRTRELGLGGRLRMIAATTSNGRFEPFASASAVGQQPCPGPRTGSQTAPEGASPR